MGHWGLCWLNRDPGCPLACGCGSTTGLKQGESLLGGGGRLEGLRCRVGLGARARAQNFRAWQGPEAEVGPTEASRKGQVCHSVLGPDSGTQLQSSPPCRPRWSSGRRSLAQSPPSKGRDAAFPLGLASEERAP